MKRQRYQLQLGISKSSQKKKKQQLPVTHPILDEKILNDFEHRRITKWIEEGIPQSIMEKYGVRYDKRANRIVYPVYDNDGNLINVKGELFTMVIKTLIHRFQNT